MDWEPETAIAVTLDCGGGAGAAACTVMPMREGIVNLSELPRAKCPPAQNAASAANIRHIFRTREPFIELFIDLFLDLFLEPFTGPFTGFTSPSLAKCPESGGSLYQNWGLLIPHSRFHPCGLAPAIA
jgi:hypothetical protein